MICEAQFGGRITDDFDRILFNTYGSFWLGQQAFDEEVCSSSKDFAVKKELYLLPR
jgi:dynein heavy chain